MRSLSCGFRVNRPFQPALFLGQSNFQRISAAGGDQEPQWGAGGIRALSFCLMLIAVVLLSLFRRCHHGCWWWCWWWCWWCWWWWWWWWWKWWWWWFCWSHLHISDSFPTSFSPKSRLWRRPRRCCRRRRAQHRHGMWPRSWGFSLGIQQELGIYTFQYCEQWQKKVGFVKKIIGWCSKKCFAMNPMFGGFKPKKQDWDFPEKLSATAEIASNASNDIPETVPQHRCLWQVPWRLSHVPPIFWTRQQKIPTYTIPPNKHRPEIRFSLGGCLLIEKSIITTHHILLYPAQTK